MSMQKADGDEHALLDRDTLERATEVARPSVVSDGFSLAALYIDKLVNCSVTRRPCGFVHYDDLAKSKPDPCCIVEI
ncbi:hypothetical protein Ciccas_002188 [Cichlidogyrus casuarinus]|uniref:Uncharacterized protein n=1 Tax=Cichlidogyrus casuarinus TaxID=1844966 RepID=A0ABD2QK59_9PLAT